MAKLEIAGTLPGLFRRRNRQELAQGCPCLCLALLACYDVTLRSKEVAVPQQKQTVVLGMGCRKGTVPAEALALARSVLSGISGEYGQLVAVATIDGKELEPALQAVAAHFAVPLLTFSAARLELETPRLASPSEVVFREIGCHGVAEAAALAACGTAAVLVVTKRVAGGATAAVAVL